MQKIICDICEKRAADKHFLKKKNDILSKPTGSLNKNKSSIA